MQGFYYCSKCFVNIEVYTLFTSNRFRRIKAHIRSCPHCGNEKLTEIERHNFKDAKHNLFLRVNRIYSFRKVGLQKISMGVKYI